MFRAIIFLPGFDKAVMFQGYKHGTMGAQIWEFLKTNSSLLQPFRVKGAGL